MDSKETLEKLITLVNEYMANIDEEMAHGDYHAPEAYIPDGYDDEDEDYWDNHSSIVNKVIDSRWAIEELIKNYNGTED